MQAQNSDVSQVSSVTVENPDQSLVRPKKLPPIKAPVGLARSPDLKNCKSKVGSLDKIKHKPTGGRVKIETQKLNWNAKSKVGSLENKDHKPAQPRVKVETRKLEWNSTSKVQSLQNIKHQPGGGNVKIFDDSYREKANATSISSNRANSKSPASKQISSQSAGASNDKAGSIAQNNNTEQIVSKLKDLNLSHKWTDGSVDEA